MSTIISALSPWWLLGTAALMAAYWVVTVFGASINAPMFTLVVQKVLRDNNVSRALKLTAAAGEVAVGKATRAALLASLSREDDSNTQVGYRGGREPSIEAVKERVRTKYDEAFTLVSRRLALGFWLALPAPILAAAATALSLTLPEPDWTAGGTGGVGLLVLLYIARMHLQIVLSRNSTFETLWPSFLGVFHHRHAWSEDGKSAISSSSSTGESGAKAAAGSIEDITLEVLEPGLPLRSVTLDEPIIKIGKLATSHLPLSAEGVARMHAVIEIADGQATIIDLGATRQTRVNGEAINKVTLAHGDVIGIGDAELVVRLPENAAEPQPV